MKLIKTRTNEPMDPQLLLQLSAKNNQRKHIFEQDEGGYLTTLWVICIPFVTFEPLCTLIFM